MLMVHIIIPSFCLNIIFILLRPKILFEMSARYVCLNDLFAFISYLLFHHHYHVCSNQFIHFTDCGGIITLSDAKRKAFIFSPKFPNDYDNNLDCHWFIKVR